MINPYIDDLQEPSIALVTTAGITGLWRLPGGVADFGEVFRIDAIDNHAHRVYPRLFVLKLIGQTALKAPEL